MSVGGKFTLQGGTEDAPSPTSGHLSYYIKSGMLYSIDSDGTIFPVGIGVPGPTGSPGPAGVGAHIENYALDAGMISAKQITLGSVPTGNVFLDIVDGCPQRIGPDFIVTGSVLSWSGKNLEGILEVDDELIVIY